mgnify:CR=1 FL=1
MLEIACLDGVSDSFELDFLEREAIPEPAMKLGIRLHLAFLLIPHILSILDKLDIDRYRSTVHKC